MIFICRHTHRQIPEPGYTLSLSPFPVIYICVALMINRKRLATVIPSEKLRYNLKKRCLTCLNYDVSTTMSYLKEV